MRTKMIQWAPWRSFSQKTHLQLIETVLFSTNKAHVHPFIHHMFFRHGSMRDWGKQSATWTGCRFIQARTGTTANTTRKAWKAFKENFQIKNIENGHVRDPCVKLKGEISEELKSLKHEYICYGTFGKFTCWTYKLYILILKSQRKIEMWSRIYRKEILKIEKAGWSSHKWYCLKHQ